MAIKFFNDQSNPQEEVLPTKTKVHKDTLNTLSKNMRVCLPGVVRSYDSAAQMATVQPSFSNQYNDGTVSPLPQIFQVPVVFPRTSGSYLHLPLKPDDRVLIFFSDKSLELWNQTGATSAPDDSRSHHITDAIAVPGCWPFNSPAKVSNPDDVILAIGNLEFHLKPNGHVQCITGMNTSSSFELLTTIDNFMTAAINGDRGGMISAQRRFRNFLER